MLASWHLSILGYIKINNIVFFSGINESACSFRISYFIIFVIRLAPFIVIKGLYWFCALRRSLSFAHLLWGFYHRRKIAAVSILGKFDFINVPFANIGRLGYTACASMWLGGHRNCIVSGRGLCVVWMGARGNTYPAHLVCTFGCLVVCWLCGVWVG